MDLETKPLSAILSDQAAAAQNAAARRGLGQALLDFSVGSVFRALAEANGAVALWLQAMILQVLSVTRATTSKGGDLDTWMADFGLTRSPAMRASGTVTFSRFTPSLVAFVPVGTLVRSADGSQSFNVIADPLLPAWDEALNGYWIAAGIGQMNLPVQAQAPGTMGNVGSGSIALLGSAVPAVDAVTNAAALSGGTDAESDAAFRARFQAYLTSLSKGTGDAIRFAVDQVQAGLTFGIIENEAPDGTYRPASFLVIVDDGSGFPRPSLLSVVASAVEAYRPVGVAFSVLAPDRVLADVQMTIATGAGVDHAEVVGLVSVAVTDFINGLDLGAPLPYTRLAQVAYAASPLVGNVTGVLLNGGTADIAGSARRVIRARSVNVA